MKGGVSGEICGRIGSRADRWTRIALTVHWSSRSRRGARPGRGRRPLRNSASSPASRTQPATMSLRGARQPVPQRPRGRGARVALVEPARARPVAGDRTEQRRQGRAVAVMDDRAAGGNRDRQPSAGKPPAEIEKSPPERMPSVKPPIRSNAARRTRIFPGGRPSPPRAWISPSGVVEEVSRSRVACGDEAGADRRGSARQPLRTVSGRLGEVGGEETGAVAAIGVQEQDPVGRCPAIRCRRCVRGRRSAPERPGQPGSRRARSSPRPRHPCYRQASARRRRAVPGTEGRPQGDPRHPITVKRHRHADLGPWRYGD